MAASRQDPHLSRVARTALLLGAQLQRTPPGCAPLWGEIKVQTVVPLWAERHQGGGVAPGCKALAEEAWGGTRASPDTAPTPQHGGTLRGRPALPLGPTGGRGHISLALRGA